MTNPAGMNIRLTPAILAEIEETMLDAIKGTNNDPSNSTYCKIYAALQQQLKTAKRGIVIQANIRDLDELRSRAEFNVGDNGVCKENLTWSTDPVDKGYWLGRMKAYKSLLAQIEALEPYKADGQ